MPIKILDNKDEGLPNLDWLTIDDLEKTSKDSLIGKFMFLQQQYNSINLTAIGINRLGKTEREIEDLRVINAKLSEELRYMKKNNSTLIKDSISLNWKTCMKLYSIRKPLKLLIKDYEKLTNRIVK